MIKVVFLKDFATRKAKEVVEMDSMIASDLVKRKIAKVYKPKKSKKE